MGESDSGPVVLSHSVGLADPFSVLSPAFGLSCLERWCLEYRGSHCQPPDFLLEQNITKPSVIWVTPWPKTVLMKVCAGALMVPPHHPCFFSPFFRRRRVISAGALRAELVGCYWLIKHGRSVPEKQGGFQCCLLSLPNEGEAKLAAVFDLRGIKTVLLSDVGGYLCVWCSAVKEIYGP